MNIKKNDNVKVITGADKNKTGTVIKVNPKDKTVIVSGVNVRKRHEKPSQSNQTGGIVSKEMPIAVSNVMIIDAKSGDTTRVRRQRESGKPSVRVSVKSGIVLD